MTFNIQKAREIAANAPGEQAMMTAEELDGLRTLLSVCPMSLDIVEVGKTLLAHIDEQARQIATSKAALVEECAWRNSRNICGGEEMSDILVEAEEMVEHPNGYAPSLITQIVGGLVVEIRRLRDERHAILGVKTKEGLTASEWVLRTGLAERQLAAKDALNNDLMANCNQLRDRCWKAESELARLQKIAIEERAERYCRSTGTNWKSLEEPLKAEYREIAAKELQLEATEEAGYTGRLEAAFLAAKGTLVWEEIDREQITAHYKDVDLPWMPAKEKGERVEREAHAALAKIRSGP